MRTRKRGPFSRASSHLFLQTSFLSPSFLYPWRGPDRAPFPRVSSLFRLYRISSDLSFLGGELSSTAVDPKMSHGGLAFLSTCGTYEAPRETDYHHRQRNGGLLSSQRSLLRGPHLMQRKLFDLIPRAFDHPWLAGVSGRAVLVVYTPSTDPKRDRSSQIDILLSEKNTVNRWQFTYRAGRENKATRRVGGFLCLDASPSSAKYLVHTPVSFLLPPRSLSFPSAASSLFFFAHALRSQREILSRDPAQKKTHKDTPLAIHLQSRS